MTAYMAKPIGHKSMQPLWFNCFLSQHSVAKYMTCRLQAFFNCLFRGKNEREWANGRLLCHCVSIKVHRWYRWPHHFRYASYFAEIHPLPSETNVKFKSVFVSCKFNSWWYYAKNVRPNSKTKGLNSAFRMSLHGKRGKKEWEIWLIYRAVGLFYSHPILIEKFVCFHWTFQQIEHKLPIALFVSFQITSEIAFERQQ